LINRIEYVTTMDFDGAEDYLTLKRPLSHYEKGIAIIEGDKVVARFLASSYELISILLTDEWFDIYRDNLSHRKEIIDVYIADTLLIKSIVGFNYHQGIIAIAKIPPDRSLDNVIRDGLKSNLLVALDRLERSENTGLIVRNCAACGAGALIVGETSADPWLRRAIRNSMGNIFKLPIIKSKSLSDTLLTLKNEYNFKIYGAALEKKATFLECADFTGNTCLVFGNEGVGLSDAILDVCDATVKIPMAEGVDSFNVACASAIMIYEAGRKMGMTNNKC
jgi:tRNA G18 (ribose-2'-O)-methylase SpoU